MAAIRYEWTAAGVDRSFELVRVEGTNGSPFGFGEGSSTTQIEVPTFFIATVPLTQEFWAHVMGGENPSCHRGDRLPLENVSWDSIVQPGGFLERINAGDIRRQLSSQASFAARIFRLPSEAEWEYAARGGPHWQDAYRFSGSNDIDRVAWYDRRDGDYTQEAARKAPNQLGIYDMSGNVWEWCQDAYTEDVQAIPTDGSHFVGENDERVLRGGCFHNWAIHCTVSKRYQIGRMYADGCIGFRLVLAGE